jgi:glycosyltransferase involved in cell wall biosynthesis
MIRFARVVWKRRHELLCNAQLLIVHDIYLLPLGRSLSTAASIPFVYDAHEEYARMEATRYPDWFLQVATKIENALARRAEFIVVPGITRTPRWSRAGFERVLVLRNTGLRNPRRIADVDLAWDILYVGILESLRRLDLLLELARTRPDIRVAIAGAGRLASEIERKASRIPNVSYLGWQNEVSHVIARARALYYGLDPAHPDAETACPNTLYLALSHRRPLVYFGGGEISEVAREFRIGVQVPVSAEGIARGVDEVRKTSSWEFEAAWASVASPEERRAYVTAVARAAGHDAGDHTLDVGRSGTAR